MNVICHVYGWLSVCMSELYLETETLKHAICFTEKTNRKKTNNSNKVTNCLNIYSTVDQARRSDIKTK